MQDADGDGGYESFVASTVTDGAGAYAFDHLTPGDYKAVEVLEFGWYLVAGSSAEVLTSGENDASGNDFVNTAYASLSGYKSEDADGKASTTDDRTGIANGTVNLYQDTNGDGSYETFVASATTDASGAYAFDHLKPGAYKAVEVIPADWYQISDSTG
ncbi:MAG: SdrD B-like domain-containing protein, partial [Rhodoblastus sp.]